MIEPKFIKGNRVRIKNHQDTSLIGVFGTITRMTGVGGEYGRTPKYKVEVQGTEGKADLDCLEGDLAPA